MKKEVELLAPAGNFEAFVAAVENGANAVYLGSKEFNARRQAENFDNEDLKRAIEYAHIRGVKVYLTLNILLTNREITRITDFLTHIASIGIDGVIVQDLGLARFIKSIIPDIKIHASTQMTVHNIQGVKELEALGFDRVVLARELGLDEVNHICNNTSLDIEIFIHGALCISYSGQCLFSSMIGGRSGNRGMCAQPCRLKYSIVKGDNPGKLFNGYILSPKDLCSVNNLDSIVNSGVKSLKIEGRMKRPEYVAVVVRVYRKYIDMLTKGENLDISKEDYNDLIQIFNRGGFTSGYLFNKAGSNMMCFEKPNNWGVYIGKIKEYHHKKKHAVITLENNLKVGDGIEFWDRNNGYGIAVTKILMKDVPIDEAKCGDTVSIIIPKEINSGVKVYKTSSIDLLNKARESYKESKLKVEIEGEIELRYNKPITFRIFDEQNNKVEVIGDTVSEKAINRPLTKARVLEQLNKLGDKPFIFKNLIINLDEDISVPISEINRIRREVIDRLSILRATSVLANIDVNEARIKAKKALNREKASKQANTKLSVFLSNISIYKDININVNRYYLPITEYLINKEKFVEFLRKQKKTETEIFIALPRIMRHSLSSILESKIDELIAYGIDGALTTGFGQVSLINKKDISFASDFTYNTFNNFSVDVLKEQGINTFTLSPELNIPQLKDIIESSDIASEAIVYGRIPLMISEFCPIGGITEDSKSQKCNACLNDNFYLFDRTNNKFPVITDKITCQSQILNSKILFMGEELKKIIKLKPDFIRLNISTETFGEMYNTIKFHRDYLDYGEEIIDNYREYIKNFKENHTKGHYFRGVD